MYYILIQEFNSNSKEELLFHEILHRREYGIFVIKSDSQIFDHENVYDFSILSLSFSLSIGDRKSIRNTVWR